MKNFLSLLSRVALILALVISSTSTGLLGYFHPDIEIMKIASAGSIEDGSTKTAVYTRTAPYGDWGDFDYFNLYVNGAFAGTTGTRAQTKWNVGMSLEVQDGTYWCHDKGGGTLHDEGDWNGNNPNFGACEPNYSFYTITVGKAVAPPLVCAAHQNKVGTDPNATCVDKPKPVCPAGTTPVGYQPDGYCLKETISYVERLKYEDLYSTDVIGLTKIIASLGNSSYKGTGDKVDGQFNEDTGVQSSGLVLDGSGNGVTSNFVSYTNIPDNNIINIMTDSWGPEFLISQGKVKLPVPFKNDGSSVTEPKWNSDLNSYLSTNSQTEVLAYEVTSLEQLQAVQAKVGGLSNLFNRGGDGVSYEYSVKALTVGSDISSDVANFKLNKSGYYILGTKYVDMVSAKSKYGNNPTPTQLKDYTFYTFTPINLSFTENLGYLPVYNNLLSQVNENLLLSGNKKANHTLSNLKYQQFKSMKVPSAFDSKSGKVLVASTNGGIQLLDSNLKAVEIINNSGLPSLSGLRVNNILSHSGDMYIASDSGVLVLDCDSNELSYTNITSVVNDINIYYDNLYLITDDRLTHYFINGNTLTENKNSYDLGSLFKNPTSVGGRIDIVGDLLVVSSKDVGSGSEVIVMSKL